MLRELTDRVLAYAQAHGITTEPYPTPLAGLKLACQYAPTPLAPVMYEPIVCLVLQGSKQAVLGDGPVSFKQGDAAVIGLDLPTESRIVQASPTKPYLALALKLDMALIRELYSELNPSPSAPEMAVAISAAEANAALIDAMGRLFGLIARPAATQVLQPLLMREIHYWLLCAGQGAMLRALAQSTSHASQIAQAMAAIRENFSTTLTVSEMAKTSA
jgi:hypothetical protein